LFSGAAPSTVAWGEQEAFRHYLTALRDQVASARNATFEATVTAHSDRIGRSETLLGRLAKSGVRGQDRDFGNYIDVDRAAMVVFERARGGRLRRSW